MRSRLRASAKPSRVDRDRSEPLPTTSDSTFSAIGMSSPAVIGRVIASDDRLLTAAEEKRLRALDVRGERRVRPTQNASASAAK